MPVNSHSLKGRRFDFQGPYSQNLKKPKLFEARGTQKIAQKNHMAALMMQNRGHIPNGKYFVYLGV